MPHLPRRDFLAQTALAMGAVAFLPPLSRADSTTLGRNRHYAANRAPLQPTPFTALPLGSVKPLGWLRTQLELQRDGLTGHAEELLPALAPDSGWLGGPGEDWEKGPYYLKGLIPLAAALDDDTLRQRAQKWIEWILSSQREDGFFGPKKNDDWWPRMVATYLLRDYHEASGDPRVLPFLTRYYAHMAKNMPDRPLRDWGKARAGDEMDTVLWLYNRTGDAALPPVAELLRQQANDWTGILTENRFLYDAGGEKVSHNVNVPQALKFSPVAWQFTGAEPDRKALQIGLQSLAADHGLAIGIESGTEHLSGRSPTQGVETCSTVEKMLSLETALRILGQAELGDALEKLAFNALPGALSAPIKQHVYYTRPNNVSARLQPSGFWQDYKDGSVPSPLSGYPCCCYNLHMGWPKYLQNCWAATHDDGLAVLAYAPSEVKAKVGAGEGIEVKITQVTDYPFNETITLKIATSQPVAFPLQLRIPAWGTSAQVAVAGAPVAEVNAGQFLRLQREWSNGDEVTLRFPMTARVTDDVCNTVSIQHGPLVYALRIQEEKRVTVPHPQGFDQYELLPASPWNYALALDRKNLSASLQFDRGAMPANPFSTEVPVRLRARGRRLPEWTMAWNEAVAFDPSLDTVTSSEPEEELTLVPFGSQYLRVTNLPVLGVGALDVKSPEKFEGGLGMRFDAGGGVRFDNHNLGPAWVAYRGGWFANEEGQIGCDGGQPGGKLVSTGAKFTDFSFLVRLAVGESGQGGVLFRASKFGTGIDDFAGYYVAIFPEGQSVLAGKANGKWHEIKKVAAELKPRQFYTLRVEARGPQCQVFLDEAAQPILEFTDSEFASGALGFRHHLPKHQTAWIRYERISVKSV